MSHSVSTPTAVKGLATLVPGSFSRLPLADVRPSEIPTQADRRARYDRADLKEFAETIKLDGVIQPIVVRPLTADPHPTYEIVAGERRWLASTMAQLLDIPAMVHNLTDEQAERWQIFENIQREDAHPLSEAEGFQRLIQEYHYTVAMVSTELGRTEAYVYGRLKLLSLCRAVRKSFEQKKLTLSHALLLARIPAESLQKRALEEILDGREEPMSPAETARHLARAYMLRLADAKFDVADETLIKAAGACGTCPKRTGNQPQLFKDVESDDVCTDPLCFDQKRGAWTARQLLAAKANGRTIIQGPDAKRIAPYGEHHLQGYVRPTDRCFADPKQRTFKQLVGKAVAPALLELPDSGELVEVIAEADVTPVLKERGIHAPRGAEASGEAARRDKAKGERIYRRALFDAVRAKSPAELVRRDLNSIAIAFCQRQQFELRKAILAVWGWGMKDRKSASGVDHQKLIQTRVPKLTDAELSRFLLDCVYAPELQVSTWSDSKATELFAACKCLKIDVEALRVDSLQAKAFKKKASFKPPAALRQRMPRLPRKGK